MSVENLPAECFFVEVNLRKKKWLICCSYNPNKNNIKPHLNIISRNLDLYTSLYENLFILGDFNVDMTDSYMKEFCIRYNLTSLIKEPTCYKNPENPSCIDLFLTNLPLSFQSSCVIETGLSDFHRMIVTVMKSTYQKLLPKIKSYRCYKKFDNDRFRECLSHNFSEADLVDNDLGGFLKLCINTLNKEVPLKKKAIRGNNLPFMNKELSKAIMNRTRLRNKFLKDKTEYNKNMYAKQRNFCVSLLRRTKRDYYNNLDERNITDNKRFWKTVTPFISDKVPSNETITLIEGDEIYSNDKDTAKIFNTFFSSIVSKMNIPSFSNYCVLHEQLNNTVLKAIVKYRYHPSIKAIQAVAKSNYLFSFNEINREEVLNEINSLDITKAAQDTDVPTKIIKENSDIFSSIIQSSYNTTVKTCEFPAFLKCANVIPIHKGESKNSKENYRPISILPNISKIFEKLMFKQMAAFMDQYFSKFQCGFRKGYSVQHCLVAMIEKWKSAYSKKKSFGALLTDLSKAFDCLPHELIIAKLHAYGFNLPALKLVQSYLTNRKQRTKVNESYSSWEEILFGVPQGSILGPLLFNIFMCDLFLLIDEVNFTSYADDNTPYSSGETPEHVVESLKDSSNKLFEWFENNHMKANSDKCHLLMRTKVPVSIEVDKDVIKNTNCEKLLGVKIDSDLSFSSHLEAILKKASQKTHVLARITPYMSFNKKKMLMNSFFMSQFNYCPLVWMCHSRLLNNKINRLHERCLRIVYCDKKSSFQELLNNDGSVSIHTKNLQTLATEMFKTYKKLSPPIFEEIFLKREIKYNLRKNSYFNIPIANNVYCGTESISNLGPRIWDQVPDRLKELNSLTSFKKEIKKWIPVNCPCRLCRTYIQNLGFI